MRLSDDRGKPILMSSVEFEDGVDMNMAFDVDSQKVQDNFGGEGTRRHFPQKNPVKAAEPQVAEPHHQAPTLSPPRL